MVALVLMALLAFGYFMQSYTSGPPVASTEPPIPALMLFTLAAGVVIGAALLAKFVANPRNRRIAEKTIGSG
jgi:hypothetical protein